MRVPLRHHQDGKQRRQTELETLQRRRDAHADEVADAAAQYPPAVVEHGHPDDLAGRGLRGQGGDERIALVGQCPGQVGTCPASLGQAVQHRQAVEDVAKIDHQGGHGDGRQRFACCEHGYRHELRRTGIDQQAHERRHPPGGACLRHEKAESDAQRDVTHGHRNGQPKDRERRGGDRGRFGRCGHGQRHEAARWPETKKAPEGLFAAAGSKEVVEKGGLEPPTSRL